LISLDYQKTSARFAHEPGVAQIREMVIDYADVSKHKIDRWKKQARIKALLPSVSLGIDRDATDLLHWDTGPNPDELTKGKEITGWDVSLNWDLADMVWSGDQTSIDSRSKLMVEMRQDLLDQAVRLYFERRRLQIETSLMDHDSPEKWQNEMRIDELTAGLDALTGGLFSKAIDRP
jgi:hypothetical protein